MDHFGHAMRERGGDPERLLYHITMLWKHSLFEQCLQNVADHQQLIVPFRTTLVARTEGRHTFTHRYSTSGAQDGVSRPDFSDWQWPPLLFLGTGSVTFSTLNCIASHSASSPMLFSFFRRRATYLTSTMQFQLTIQYHEILQKSHYLDRHPLLAPDLVTYDMGMWRFHIFGFGNDAMSVSTGDPFGN